MYSMTGFSRAESSHDGLAIVWELKSVNGRSLEVRLRFPQGLDRYEPAARATIQRRFSRGNISGILTVTRLEGAAIPHINRPLLQSLTEAAMRLHAESGCAPPSADGLLALRGVLEAPAPGDDPALSDDGESAIFACLELALDQLAQARRVEGEALTDFLMQRIARIEALVEQAELDPSREPHAMRERLQQQLQPLLEASSSIDEQRLYQEAALLATRADIREEIDRLKAHIASARSLLANGGTVGRKLDFLAQEFNREANTLCSKSHAATITAIGLELKATVDQFREQVQNLE